MIFIVRVFGNDNCTKLRQPNLLTYESSQVLEFDCQRVNFRFGSYVSMRATYRVEFYDGCVCEDFVYFTSTSETENVRKNMFKKFKSQTWIFCDLNTRCACPRITNKNTCSLLSAGCDYVCRRETAISGCYTISCVSVTSKLSYWYQIAN